MTYRNHKAFTLIELLVVIAIIGILAGFIFVSMNASITAAQDAKRKVDISNIQKAILMYEAAGGVLPNTSGSDCDLDPGNASACDDFATKLQPYLKTIPTAPDGDFYVYNHDSSADNITFSVEGTLSSGNTYGYSSGSGGGWYENPATPPPEEEEGITFTEIAHFSYGSGSAMSIEKYYDEYFLSNGTDGVRVFTFDAETVADIAHVATGGTAYESYPSYPDIVYVAAGSAGYKSYSFDGSTFTPVNSVNDGGEARSTAIDWSNTYSQDIPYLANGTDGLRAYSPALSSISHIDDGGEANDVSICYYVFLSNGDDGLRAYTYNDVTNTFSYSGHIDSGGEAMAADCSENTMFFLANGSDGLRAYSYDYDSSTFTEAGHIDDGGTATGVYAPSGSMAGGGYVFLANGTDGLRVYTYDSDLQTFTNIGHINSGGQAKSVLVTEADDSHYLNIFLSNGTDGVRVYQIDNPNYGNVSFVDYQNVFALK